LQHSFGTSENWKHLYNSKISRMTENQGIDEINNSAFRFVGNLVPFKGQPETVTEENKNLRGDGTEMILDLGEIDNFEINPISPIDGKLNSKYRSVKGRIIGIDENGFIEFAAMIENIQQLPAFFAKCDFNFLVQNTFDWIIDIYINGRAPIMLIDYLREKIENESKEHTLYFRIDGIQMEDDFAIGNCQITFISDQSIEGFINSYLQKKEAVNIDEIRTGYQIMKGVNIKASITSTSDNAKNICLREAELSMDVLKCFLGGYSLNQYYAIPDLEHRKNGAARLSYWVFASEVVPSAPDFKNLGGFIALPIDNAFIAEAKKRGIEIFSNFIKKKFTDSLYSEITDAIQRFAKIISTSNNYEKVVKAISLLEGCILERSNKSNGNGEGKIKKYVLPKLTTNQIQIFEKSIRKAYHVRNLYVHNSTEIPLNEQDLWVLLEIVRLFIIKLINLHESGKRQFETIQDFFLVT